MQDSKLDRGVIANSFTFDAELGVPYDWLFGKYSMVQSMSLDGSCFSDDRLFEVLMILNSLGVSMPFDLYSFTNRSYLFFCSCILARSSSSSTI